MNIFDQLSHFISYPQRQDENPCMKTVWEMDAQGGGGVGGYETDEEEFLDSPEYRKHLLISVPAPIQARGAVKNKNTAKRKKKSAVETRSGPKNKYKGYQLTEGGTGLGGRPGRMRWRVRGRRKSPG